MLHSANHMHRYPGAYGGGGGGGFGNLLLYGILAVFVVSALQGLLNRGDTDDYGAPKAPSLLLPAVQGRQWARLLQTFRVS